LDRTCRRERLQVFRTNFFLYLLSLSILFLSSACADDWPQWLGPERNGTSTETGWNQNWKKEGLETLWTFEAGIGFTPPSIASGLLVTLGYDSGNDVVYCLKPESGEEVWSYSYPCGVHDYQHEGGPAAAPAIDGDRVYTYSRDGELFCFEIGTGRIVWRERLHDRIKAEEGLFGYIGSPVVAGDLVIVDAGAAAALDKKTGELVWNSENFRTTCASPQLATLGGADVVSLFNATGLVLFEVGTGKEFSRKSWITPKFDTNTATPVFVDSKVFITSGYDRGYALLEIEGRKEPGVLWKDEDARTYHNNFIPKEDHLYGFIEKDFVCLSVESGKILWRENLPVKGCQILVDGKFLIYSEKGELILAKADPKGYEELGRTHNLGGTCWTPPVLANGRIYLRNSKGKIVCLDARLK